MKNKAVIIGAGRLGKGCLGEIFCKHNWDVSFVDKDQSVIDTLNENGSYDVKVFTKTEELLSKVFGYTACNVDSHSIGEVINSADVIAICVFPEDIDDVLNLIYNSLKQSIEDKEEKNCQILFFTNQNNKIATYKNTLLNKMNSDLHEYFNNTYFLSDTIIRRSTDSQNNVSLDIETVDVAPILIQSPVNNKALLRCSEFKVVDNLSVLKELKLYIINGPHAATAYYGAYYGIDNIQEVLDLSDGLAFVRKVFKEIIAGVIANYDITSEEITSDILIPKSNKHINDSVYRVGFDPIRKISLNDRLVGSALMCEKSGNDYDNIAKATALALMYCDENDTNSKILNDYIKEYNIESAIVKFCGLDSAGQVSQSIIKHYNSLKK